MRDRDQRAIEELVAVLRRKIRGYLESQCGEDWEDLFQEIALRTVLAIQSDSIEHPKRVLVWAHRAARNLVIDRYRRKRQKNPHNVVSIDEARTREAKEENVLESLIRRETLGRIVAAFERLGNVDRELVRLYYFERQRDKAIAQTLQMPITALKARRWRAFQRLREEFHRLEGGGLAWAA